MADDKAVNKSKLVFLHGWGVNQGVWQGIFSRLGDNTGVIALDLPGFGLAGSYPEPYTLDAVCQQLAEQISDGSVICGWSLGGLLAIALAKRYPEKVSKLALVAASPCFLAQPGWPGMAPQIMQQFASALTENLPQTIERFLAIQAMGSDSARADAKALKQAILAYPSAQPQAVIAALSLLSESDLRADFAALDIPITALFGRLDSLVPAKVVPLLQQLQPKAVLSVLPQASHAPFISHPDAFIAWLQPLLSANEN